MKCIQATEYVIGEISADATEGEALPFLERPRTALVGAGVHADQEGPGWVCPERDLHPGQFRLRVVDPGDQGFQDRRIPEDHAVGIPDPDALVGGASGADLGPGLIEDVRAGQVAKCIPDGRDHLVIPAPLQGSDRAMDRALQVRHSDLPEVLQQPDGRRLPRLAEVLQAVADLREWGRHRGSSSIARSIAVTPACMSRPRAAKAASRSATLDSRPRPSSSMAEAENSS
jgi:hypothetical protein